MSVGTMVKQVITSWIDGRVLFECEVSADIAEGLRLKAALEIGVKARADLDGANLTRANLYGADLDGANLTRANLTRANLDGANLTRANLTRANLTRANLYGANLTRANLDGAEPYGANLDGANLGDTKLIDGGLRSDGYRFWLIHSTEQGWRIKAGCRNFTVADARTHWSQARDVLSLNIEALAIVDHMLALAKIRGWEVE